MLQGLTNGRVWATGCLLIVTLALMGCSQDEASKKADIDLQHLEKRVQERWQTKIAHDWEGLYEYTTPTFRRTFPKAMYIRKFSYMLNWELTGIEVRNYDADAAVASVAVRVMSEPVKHTSEASRAAGALPHTFNERWVFDEGEWWHSANL